MALIITVVHILVCLALIFVVLLQKGSGADMGAAFGGSSQSVFGSRGSGSFLGKLTATLATVFMITSLSLAFFTTQKGAGISVMGVPVAGSKAREAQKTPPATAEEKESIPPKSQEGSTPSAPAATPANSGTKPVPTFDGSSSQAPVVPKGDTKSAPVAVKPNADTSQTTPASGVSPASAAQSETVKEASGAKDAPADAKQAPKPLATESGAQSATTPSDKP